MISALIVTALACSANPNDRTFSLPPAPYAAPADVTTTLGTTAALVSDSVTRTKIETLHANALHQGVIFDSAAPDGFRMGLVPTVSGKATGPGGDENAEWRAYDDATKSISTTDASALLHHEDPAIRAYFVWYLSEAEKNGDLTNEELANLFYPLFFDDAKLEVRSGCTSRHETVASEAMWSLAMEYDWATARGRTEILKTVFQDDRITPDLRALAMEGLVDTDPAAASTFAKTAATSDNEEMRKASAYVLTRIDGTNRAAAASAEHWFSRKK